MALSDSQKKVYINRIAQAEKRIIDIQTRAEREIANEKKKIIEAQKSLNRG
ncbi:hypothetical protein B0F89_1433 [Malaciobacter marinus]|jgi:hypothetical protein|uniref:Uncharacterized protein n=1 Tax=Malaciobacter marinus TaxID=505249 RepID=A0AB36ZT33_9BACT|nr:hypothetical protein [Malaciobacter marinus]PPK57878.1 hypothetical protein B0F89_1433 [Malaciobacter marinus]